MPCTCRPAPLTFGRRDRIRATCVDQCVATHNLAKEVTGVKTTMTCLTYPSAHAVTTAAVSGRSPVASQTLEHRQAPVFGSGQGTLMSAFADRDRVEQLINKSIAPLPANDVVGASRIRSWSPPV